MFKERLSLFALIAIVFLIGVVFILAAESVAKTNEFWGDFVRDLGIAVVISSVVAFAFERYLRERLYQQIEGRIASILDRFRLQAVDSFELQKLPQEILDVVRQEILAANVIDRNLQVHYEIEEFRIDDQTALAAWEIATKEERREMLQMMLDAVYVVQPCLASLRSQEDVAGKRT